ncbi:hypothetical protein MTO96_024855 [Rhipicephalus appendiculatus]
MPNSGVLKAPQAYFSTSPWRDAQSNLVIVVNRPDDPTMLEPAQKRRLRWRTPEPRQKGSARVRCAIDVKEGATRLCTANESAARIRVLCVLKPRSEHARHSPAGFPNSWQAFVRA